MCECNAKMNALLDARGSNTVISEPLLIRKESLALSSGPVTIVTTKKDSGKRQKPITVFASYCPFCGDKYRNDAEPNKAGVGI